MLTMKKLEQKIKELDNKLTYVEKCEIIAHKEIFTNNEYYEKTKENLIKRNFYLKETRPATFMSLGTVEVYEKNIGEMEI